MHESPDLSLPPVTLVLGGARSGKSAFAESLLGGGLYVATAEARDHEMAERIRRHRKRRGAAWETVEAPLDLTGALRGGVTADTPALVDCLTLWLSNLMEAGRDPESEARDLAAALAGLPAPVVLVANEVGWGVVPDNALARAFADHAGRLNQTIAAAAQRVHLVTAGLPLTLKDNAS